MKDVYTLFYQRTHLRLKEDFHQKKNKKEPQPYEKCVRQGMDVYASYLVHTNLEANQGSYMFLVQTTEMILKTQYDTHTHTHTHIYIDGLKTKESITETRIEEENVGHGKDPHFLIALTMM